MSELPFFEPRQDSRPNDVVWPQVKWPVDDAVVLSGTFVELRPSIVADAPELFAALDHDAVWAHVAGRPVDIAAMEKLIEFKRGDASWAPWTVRLTRDYVGMTAGTVVGTSSFLETFPHEARTEIGSTTYTPAVWGSNVNPECKLLLLTFAFEELKMGRVQLKTDIRNQRSQQAIARLGAQFEGVIRRYQRRQDGTVRDTVLFSIIAEEWPEVQGRLKNRLAAE
jgi:RimJ/RimL family protein N-acetyltransferase